MYRETKEKEVATRITEKGVVDMAEDTHMVDVCLTMEKMILSTECHILLERWFPSVNLDVLKKRETIERGRDSSVEQLLQKLSNKLQ